MLLLVILSVRGDVDGDRAKAGRVLEQAGESGVSRAQVSKAFSALQELVRDEFPNLYQRHVEPLQALSTLEEGTVA